MMTHNLNCLDSVGVGASLCIPTIFAPKLCLSCFHSQTLTFVSNSCSGLMINARLCRSLESAKNASHRL